MSQQEGVTDAASTMTRRERYRQQTIDEIRSLAMAQVLEGGEAAVSLNAIAKTMAVSPGALYRYFDNRDALIAELVIDAYGQLADHLQLADRPPKAAASGPKPAERLRALGRAYRDWALDSPNRYRLVFESTQGSGLVLAADRIVPAAQRSMDVFLQVLMDAGAGGGPPLSAQLEKQVRQWGLRAGHAEVPAAVLATALLLWTRLHGLVSLEIGQHLNATGIDPALLFDAELEHLVHLAGLPAATARTARRTRSTPTDAGPRPTGP